MILTSCTVSIFLHDIGSVLDVSSMRLIACGLWPCILVTETVTSPCTPNPCGSNAECREHNGGAACTCVKDYQGSPPNCRPECVVSADCASHLACVGYKCRDPCDGQCGANAQCRVRSHVPMCSCIAGYQGDPFRGCTAIPISE